MSKAKLLIIISSVVVFCFVPVIDMPYEVIVEKQVSEEYTTVEPYTVQEEVREPYTASVPSIIEEDYKGPPETMSVTRWRTVTKEVTKYRGVTKTRLVTRPVVETRTKRVSILRYLLR